MPVEKSGQNEFDFEYGDDFGAHIEKFDPDFSKVLVRYNPDGDAEMNERQLERLKRLADWLHENDRKFLFELLVPADRRAARVGRRRHRPLRRRAAPRADAPRDRRDSRTSASRSTSGRSRASTSARTPRCSPSRPARATGARASSASLLGRGASDEKVDQWLRAAAPVEGFVGFAIGRSIWWDALKGYLDGDARRARPRRRRSPTTTCASSASTRSRRRRSPEPLLAVARARALRGVQKSIIEGAAGGRSSRRAPSGAREAIADAPTPPVPVIHGADPRAPDRR